LHIQNGLATFAPPAGVLLAALLGLEDVRVLAIDGMCAEPIPALEMAVLMLQARRARRVILSTSADFLSMIDKTDPGTTGLFGAGAGVLILEAEQDGAPASTVHSLHWETHSKHWELGRMPFLRSTPRKEHVELDVGYYTMDGQRLAKVAIRILPQVLKPVLDEAGWAREDVDLLIAHQPNAKMLEMGVRALGLNAGIVPMPVRRLGNMGPASLLVNLSVARDEGRLPAGRKVLLIAFGLGFSCGAAAVEI
jgi:3-oxoacyl-[acyl-carrier-protein] synthase-3